MMKKKVIIPALFVIIIIVGIGAYYLTKTPPTPPEEIPERPPEIVDHIAYLDQVDVHITFFTVVGVIQNNLRTNIEAVNVTATFYDAADYMIGTRYTPIVVEILKPEQRSPFVIYLRVEPSTVLTDISYELALEYFKTDTEPITGLVILNSTPSIDQNGYHIIKGEIQNRGLRRAYSVSLFCIYYDAENNFLAMSRTFVTAVMELTEKVSFQTSSKPHKISPAKYELYHTIYVGSGNIRERIKKHRNNS